MIKFWIKEAFKLIARSKFSFFLSLVSITLSVILITLSVFIIQFSNHFEQELKSNIVISVFIKDKIVKTEIDSIKSELQNFNFLKSADYVSKDEAAEIFVKETGEDFRKILDYNPLPASFNLKLKSEYAVNDSIKKIITDLSKLSWSDDVVFRQDFYQKILSYIEKGKVYVFALTGLIFLVSIYLVYSTVRLILNSKYSELETMKFVGAKLSTIKMPIILNSALAGLIAGFTALAISMMLYYYASEYLFSLDQIIRDKYLFIIILLSTGPLIGVFVTIISLRKISLKI
ncbi:MAG: permease-like cell division protein FtsX [Ignavibacteriaceae bacterium]|jgi:cell division transport system permease protein|nr:permease-like cell division protein FtsX [Ignavibacteriaceae bacterium]